VALVEQPLLTCSSVEVKALAVRTKDGDEFDGAVDRAEPMWGPGAEFDRLARPDDQVLVT